MISLQNAAGILPRNRRSRLNLCPRYLGMVPATGTALGNEVVDSSHPILIARVPILNGRILDLCVVERNKFYHGRMQLVFIAHGRSASL